MKKTGNILAIFALSLMVIFTSCTKKDNYDKSDEAFKLEEADLVFIGDGDFEKVITNPLVKLDDCKYIVAGTIEFRKSDAIIAVIDFGDGSCDNIATKTVDGETTEFILEKEGKENKYKKVVVEPLVKIDGCEFIVSGIVKFYEGDKWVATIDFGDGTCDEWATKTWDGGSKTFSLIKD
ncbi:MAG: hypothetical protein DRI89_06400 [Bacteroidetes bacterium]|nr:MAG: hypothetical protein DRI89_06400 [Bacteroidota bacterium]